MVGRNGIVVQGHTIQHNFDESELFTHEFDLESQF